MTLRQDLLTEVVPLSAIHPVDGSSFAHLLKRLAQLRSFG
jgi:hypothetical protein